MDDGRQPRPNEDCCSEVRKPSIDWCVWRSVFYRPEGFDTIPSRLLINSESYSDLIKRRINLNY